MELELLVAMVVAEVAVMVALERGLVVLVLVALAVQELL